MAVLTFGAFAFSRHVGLLSHDPLLPSCVRCPHMELQSPCGQCDCSLLTHAAFVARCIACQDADLLATAPDVQLRLKTLPETMKALSRSLRNNSSNVSSSYQQRAQSAHVVAQVSALIRTSQEARKLLRCAGGAQSLGGVDAAKHDQAHRALWRLYGRARKLSPAPSRADGRPRRGVLSRSASRARPHAEAHHKVRAAPSAEIRYI